MLIRRGTEEHAQKSYAFPKPDTIAVQNFLVNAGEYEGKMNSFVRATLNPGFDLPFHEHDDCEEIFTIVSGHAVYTDGNKEKHTLGPGDVAVCNCGEGHGIGNPFDEPTILIELNLKIDKK